MVDVADETSRTRSIVLEGLGRRHRAGQHVDVRLTAEDGYQAQRSYSIASAPWDDHLVLTVERLDDGEVSPYLADELRVGDELEVRGPIGGYFVWEESLGGPLFLVGGGSGVVPLRSMLRHHGAIGSTVPVRLLYSARSLDDVIYRDEVERMSAREEIDVRLALTRRAARGLAGVRPADRRGDARGGRVAAGRAAAHVHLRADRLRRDGRDCARRARPRAGPDQNRALRPDRGDMSALDGNAIAGALREVFGAEMTMTTGECAACGARAMLAETDVYVRAPGTVVRCRSCAAVLIVLVTIRGRARVYLSGLAALEPEPATGG